MTASEIINNLLKYSRLNASAFSKTIGLERPQAIYDIQKGKTETISVKMADKIISVFPEVRKSWLLTGEGEMLKETPTDADILSLAGKNEFLMAYLQEKDRKIEELLRENARLQMELSQAQQQPKEPFIIPVGKSVTPPHRVSTSKTEK